MMVCAAGVLAREALQGRGPADALRLRLSYTYIILPFISLGPTTVVLLMMRELLCIYYITHYYEYSMDDGGP